MAYLKASSPSHHPRLRVRFLIGIANHIIYQHAGRRCLYNNMKNAFKMLVLAFVAAARACGGEALMLKADVTLRFAFPDLPDTFATMESGVKQPAQLTARLPENYSREGRFPLCVYLEGGSGGRGDRHGIARAIVGARDFICVNLPLFKRAYHTNDGGLVSLDDFPTVSRAYGTMLQKLLDTVPNITPERSVLGGFSNGAHTAALLVAGEDEFTLRHFQAFYFAEGGAPLAANALQKNSLRRLRFLYLRSDRAGSLPGTEGWPCISQAIEHFAKAQTLDFTTIVMRDTGHDFPPKYMALTGRWIRGERPPLIEKE
jgi:hypothetical protein